MLRRGADALGWANSEIPRWMAYPDRSSPDGGERQSMTRTYLPQGDAGGGADDRRSAAWTGCSVDGRRARSAPASPYAGGRPGTIRFQHVIVCGGAIQTPALLQRSGIRGVVGTSLAVHPTVKLAARFADAINVPDDVPVHQVKEFAPDLSFGGSASQPGTRGARPLRQLGRLREAVHRSGATSPSTTPPSRAKAGAGCAPCPAARSRSSRTG